MRNSTYYIFSNRSQMTNSFLRKNLLFHAFYRCYLGMEFLMVQKFMRLQRKSSGERCYVLENNVNFP